MNKSGIHKIHPSFRIVALAEPPILNSSMGNWLNSELLNLFLFYEMRPLEKTEELHIIKEKVSVTNLNFSNSDNSYLNVTPFLK